MSLFSDFAGPLISPFENSVSSLNNIIDQHNDAQNQLQSIVQSLSGLDGTGQLSGLTGEAVSHATQQLVQMTNQRLDVMKQAIDAFKSCSSNAGDAVSKIEGGLSIGDIIEKIFEHFDLIGVIINGRSIVDAAIDAVKQVIINDMMSDPFALLGDVLSAVADMFGGAEIQIPEYAMTLYSEAQEVMKVLKLLQEVVSMLQSMASNPIKDLFSNIPAFASDVTKGGYAQIFQQDDPSNLLYGLVNMNPSSIDPAVAGPASTLVNNIAQPLVSQVGIAGTTLNQQQVVSGVSSVAGNAAPIVIVIAGAGTDMSQAAALAQTVAAAINGQGQQLTNTPLPQPDAVIHQAINGQLGGTVQAATAPLAQAATQHSPLGYYASAPIAGGQHFAAASPVVHPAAPAAPPAQNVTAARPMPPMGMAESGFGTMAMGIQGCMMVGMAIMQGMARGGQGGGAAGEPTANILS